MPTGVTGREFRDWAADARYPFEDMSTLAGDQGYLVPQGLFLDAMLCAGGSARPPFHVSAMTGSGAEGDFDVVVSDASGYEIARAPVSPWSSDTHFVFRDRYGFDSGVLLVDKALARIASRAVAGRTETFKDDALRFLASRCYAVSRPEATSLVARGEALTGDVVVMGLSGVEFDFRDGKLFVEYHGTDSFGNAQAVSGLYVKTINGVINQRPVLIASHASSVKPRVDKSEITLVSLENVE